ncbi:putative PRAME family member 26 [Trichechus manatus latirostris]|uniref:PRAME family member 26 n=1 Tax=Trichechus manatus latirostris TaxID=127582 RepID=A0A2Y9G5P1_TRIMA|nr:putative PRAME family member 26 [Trichechus manatus latirostris]
MVRSHSTVTTHITFTTHTVTTTHKPTTDSTATTYTSTITHGTTTICPATNTHSIVITHTAVTTCSTATTHITVPTCTAFTTCIMVTTHSVASTTPLPPPEPQTSAAPPPQPIPLLLTVPLKATPDEYLTFLMKRAKQRKGLPYLCCRKLEFVDMPFGHLQKILKMVQLDCVQEVEVNGSWDLFTLARFAPPLGQMVNLSRLLVSHILMNSFIPWVAEEVEKLVFQFSSQLLSLHQLQELYLDSVFFPEGHLDQVLRCLKTPLVSLLITNFLLLESNLTYLLSYLNTSHLKYLNLSDLNMMGLSPEFLQVLLERSSATLHCLELDGCGIMDYQLTSILPTLGHRSQLTSFSFHGNPVSAEALESLLQHTVLLSKFRLRLFPVPLECYVGLQGTLNLWNLRGYLAELRLILLDLELPNAVLLPSDSTCSYHAILLYCDLM